MMKRAVARRRVRSSRGRRCCALTRRAGAGAGRAGQPRSTRATRSASIRRLLPVSGDDSRVDDDVLLADLRRRWLFDIDDFNGVTFGGEWLFGLGDFLEAGVGVGYYQNTVHSVYRDFVNDDGTEIDQDLKLRDRADHRDRALPADRPRAASSPTSAPASASSTGATARSASSSTSDDSRSSATAYVADGTAVGPGHARRRPLPDRRRVDDRRRGPLAEGRRRHRAGRERSSSATRSISAAGRRTSRFTSGSNRGWLQLRGPPIAVARRDLDDSAVRSRQLSCGLSAR